MYIPLNTLKRAIPKWNILIMFFPFTIPLAYLKILICFYLYYTILFLLFTDTMEW